MGSGEQKWKQRQRSLSGTALSPLTSPQDSSAIRWDGDAHGGQQQFLCFTHWSSLASSLISPWGSSHRDAFFLKISCNS